MELYTKNEQTDQVDAVECYGRFDIKSTICRKYCAVRMRCAIDQSEQLKAEQLEDMMSAYEMPLKIQ